MANRLDYYFKQKVTEAELDLGFEYLETADRAIVADHGLTGITKNANVNQHSPTPDLTVDLQAASTVHGPGGERMAWGPIQNVNLALDSDSASTAVVTPGNTKWVSVFIKPDRILSDPRIDGNSVTVYFSRAESFLVLVVQGAESVSPSKPALRSDAILLADVLLAEGQTSILDGDINTDRAQYTFETTSSTIRARTIAEAFQQIEDAIASVVGGSFGASAINYGGGTAWADGDTNPAASVEATLDSIFADLSSSAGGAKIGGAVYSPTPGAFSGLSAGTLQAQLRQLADGLSGSTLASSITYGGGGGWANGGAIASASVEAILDNIFADMADTSKGAFYIAACEDDSGATGGPYWLDSDVKTALNSLIKNIVDGNGSANGIQSYALKSQSVVRCYLGGWGTGTAGTWVNNIGAEGDPYQDVNSSSDPMTIYLEDLPHGAVITKIRVLIDPAGSHSATGPTTMPKFNLISRNTSAVKATESGPHNDPYPAAAVGADLTNYEAVHFIDSGTISVTLDKTTKRYALEVYGEAGSGSTFQQGLRVRLAEVTFTTTRVDPGAG